MLPRKIFVSIMNKKAAPLIESCRTCLIIGGMTNSEGFFRQTKMIFRRRTGLYVKKNQQSMAEKDPLLGVSTIFKQVLMQV